MPASVECPVDFCKMWHRRPGCVSRAHRAFYDIEEPETMLELILENQNTAHYERYYYQSVLAEFELITVIDGVLDYRSVGVGRHMNSYGLNDCSTESYYCIGDQTGFEISLPKGFDIERSETRSWATENYSYHLVAVALRMPSSTQHPFTVRQYSNEEFVRLIQFRPGCGLVSYYHYPEIPFLRDGEPQYLTYFRDRCGLLQEWLDGGN
jgi:hypothetical protein